MYNKLPAPLLARIYSGCPVLRHSAEGPCLPYHKIIVSEPEYGVFHPLGLARDEYEDEAHSSCLIGCVQKRRVVPQILL